MKQISGNFPLKVSIVIISHLIKSSAALLNEPSIYIKSCRHNLKHVIEASWFTEHSVCITVQNIFLLYSGRQKLIKCLSFQFPKIDCKNRKIQSWLLKKCLMVILGKVCNSVVVASFGKQYSSSELISQTCTCQILEGLVINEEKPVSRKF